MMEAGYVGSAFEDRAEGHREVGLWALVAGIALAMRLAQLDAVPLNSAEARQATVAWLAARGQGMPIGGYSPLLLVGNALLFVLFGAGDAMARFWPAVFGSALALTPVLLRRRLGRVGALASGLYLAISPTALIASRQLGGGAIAAAGTMAAVGGLSRFVQTGRRGWITFAAVGLAAGVVGGAEAYGLVLPLTLAWVLVSQLGPDGYATPGRRAVSRLRPHAARLLTVFALSAAALSTGLGWNLSGIGAIGGLLVDWFGRFELTGGRAASLLTLLGVYELAGVVFGVGGLVWGLRRRHYWAALLGVWAGLGTLLLAVMPGRAPTDLLWVVLPLAMLAGLAVQAVVRDRWPVRLGACCVYSVLVLVLWAQVYLTLARYAAFGQFPDLVLVVIIVGLQALLGLTFGLVLGPGAALRVGAAATGIALLGLTVSVGWGVAYRRPVDPREPLLSGPTDVNVHDLVETLHNLSWEQTGMRTTLEFVYEAPPDSVLAWYLRDFEMARRVDRLSELKGDEVAETVVTVDDGVGLVPARPGREYVGQSFTLRRRWEPSSIGCRFWERGCSIAFDWFLFRDGPALPEAEQEATLWRRVELGDADW